MSELADQQAALVAALVAGGPVPPGVDPGRLAVARKALLRKRSGEVAAAFPQLAAALGAGWHDQFIAWADGRPPAGPSADGRAFAGTLDPRGLPEAAVREYLRAVTATPGPAGRRTRLVRRVRLAWRVRLVRRGRRLYLGRSGRAWQLW